jgi:hypothetical protein
MVNLKFKYMQEEVSLCHTPNSRAMEDGFKAVYLVYRMESIKQGFWVQFPVWISWVFFFTATFL